MQVISTVSGDTYTTPLFLPVFQHDKSFITPEELKNEFSIRGIITNAYLIYKKKELRSLVVEKGIKQFLGFDGLVVTDSGAFQQFSGPLYLSNSTIVTFQQDIGADILAPLDIITYPRDNKKTAKKKLEATQKRIRKGVELTDRAILTGVQQGGRFLDLRGQALTELVDLGLKYIALGSLVPFFNKNHNIEFIGKVIKQARTIVPAHIPIHLYGSGDPLEIPFYIALGCDVFDSSSFVHYAKDDWYMTPYGALKGQDAVARTGYVCTCPYCQEDAPGLWLDYQMLSRHNLWVIQDVMQKATQLVDDGGLHDYLNHVIEQHQEWFPESRLTHAWAVLTAV